MGGVDVHNQLRLQRYSLQLSAKLQKNYKGLFLGLVVMAMVNAFVVLREAVKRAGKRQSDPSKFLSTLQAQLLALTSDDFALGNATSPPRELFLPVSSDHQLLESPDYQTLGDTKRRRSRQCKVCSLLKTSTKERQRSKYYRPACSEGTAQYVSMR